MAYTSRMTAYHRKLDGPMLHAGQMWVYCGRLRALKGTLYGDNIRYNQNVQMYTPRGKRAGGISLYSGMVSTRVDSKLTSHYGKPPK
jgi:hypothetical protein